MDSTRRFPGGPARQVISRQGGGTSMSGLPAPGRQRPRHGGRGWVEGQLMGFDGWPRLTARDQTSLEPHRNHGRGILLGGHGREESRPLPCVRVFGEPWAGVSRYLVPLIS
eukprot:scaffold16942_cov118-Isochrysis_galbana.AAC.5